MSKTKYRPVDLTFYVGWNQITYYTKNKWADEYRDHVYKVYNRLVSLLLQNAHSDMYLNVEQEVDIPILSSHFLAFTF